LPQECCFIALVAMIPALQYVFAGPIQWLISTKVGIIIYVVVRCDDSPKLLSLNLCFRILARRVAAMDPLGLLSRFTALDVIQIATCPISRPRL
jgi:hypothetical protein